MNDTNQIREFSITIQNADNGQLVQTIQAGACLLICVDKPEEMYVGQAAIPIVKLGTLQDQVNLLNFLIDNMVVTHGLNSKVSTKVPAPYFVIPKREHVS